MAKEGQRVPRSSGPGSKAAAGQKKGVMLPRGPRSAYTLFYQCARRQLSEERPELSFREFPTICSQLWRNMPDDERALWQADSAQDKERYERELMEMAAKQAHESQQLRKDEVHQGGVVWGWSGGDMRAAGGGGGGDIQGDVDCLFDHNAASTRYRSSSNSWQDFGTDFWQQITRQVDIGSLPGQSPPLSPQQPNCGTSSSNSSNNKKRKNMDEAGENYSPLGDKEYTLHTDLEGA